MSGVDYSNVVYLIGTFVYVSETHITVSDVHRSKDTYYCK